MFREIPFSFVARSAHVSAAIHTDPARFPVEFVLFHIVDSPANNALQPTPVSVLSSAIAVHASHPAWLSLVVRAQVAGLPPRAGIQFRRLALSDSVQCGSPRTVRLVQIHHANAAMRSPSTFE